MRATVLKRCASALIAAALSSTHAAWCRADAAVTPPNSTKPDSTPSPSSMIELGIFPVLGMDRLSCASCSLSENTLLSPGAGITVGYRYGLFVLSGYGEFGRGLNGLIGVTHSALGAAAQFGLSSSVPLALRARMFHDEWSFSGGSRNTLSVQNGQLFLVQAQLPARHVAGFGVGVDVVFAPGQPVKEASPGFELFLGLDIADLGTFTDLSGPRDTDAHVWRGLFGARFYIDTRLGCSNPCPASR